METFSRGYCRPEISEALDDESDGRRHANAAEALAEMFAASPAVGVEIVMRGGVGAHHNLDAHGR